jgi:putative tryptophan/tyrosine transport system substrate-binding protein
MKLPRREFIALVGGAAVWPVAARAQQSAMPVVGFIGSETPQVSAGRIQAFRQGLREAGYVEGRNVAIAFQWAGGNYGLLSTLADEFVRQKVAVLVAAGSTLTARAIKAATASIPVVFFVGSDPVGMGLVDSLNRPGGNVTGITGLDQELMPKRVELLHEAVPSLQKILVLVNPNNLLGVQPYEMKNTQQSAEALGLELDVLYAKNENDLDRAFLMTLEGKTGGILISRSSRTTCRAFAPLSGPDDRHSS